MADNASRVKIIAAALEATYQNLRAAARNISGLLSVGRATCDEVRAYNLWALATYNAQRGMLATLRAAGEQGVPTLPAYPTLFAWQGQDGASAVDINCSGQPSSLSGPWPKRAMRRALRGPTSSSTFLSTDQIQVVTQDQWAMNPESSPSWAALQQTQDAQLGSPLVVLLVIAGIAIGVAVGLGALMDYLEENSIQEETTERTRIQADAFQRYTAARLSCYSTCTASGKSIAECVDTCARLVEKPDIKIDSARGVAAWGTLQWIGAVVVIGTGAIIAHKLYKKRQAGERILPTWMALPSAP